MFADAVAKPSDPCKLVNVRMEYLPRASMLVAHSRLGGLKLAKPRHPSPRARVRWGARTSPHDATDPHPALRADLSL